MFTSNLSRISILTPSFNQGRFIEQNILSVLEQRYPNLEHIIIDGGSTDDTVSILRRYSHLKWVSERDAGQSDALNKGFAMASGDIVGWLNSDDYYASGVFAQLANCFAVPATQWVIGGVTKVYNGNIGVSHTPAAIDYQRLLQNPDIVSQPGTFYRRDALHAAGGWDPALYMVMDYDLWLRLARMAKPVMVPNNWAYFRLHPEQKTGARNISRQYGEIDYVLRKHSASLKIRIQVGGRKRFYHLKARLKDMLFRHHPFAYTTAK